MDDLKTSLFSSLIASLIFSVGLSAHALDMEYIGPEESQQLEKDFNKAQFTANQQAQLSGKKWTCDMYGVRSRLQVQRGVKLYEFKAAEPAKWTNSGAQLVNDYTVDAGQMIGRRAQFEDRIKMTTQGQLISRLSLAEGDHRVLAYSVCKSL